VSYVDDRLSRIHRGRIIIRYIFGGAWYMTGKRFLVDRMLGKLAKKLRMLGFDTLYFSEIEENELLTMASNEGRILLTRDKELFEKAVKRGIETFLIKSDRWRSQISAVLKRFRISENDLKLFSRCMECNTVLKEVSKQDVVLDVPEYVYMTHERFLKCPMCGKVYWAGTHVEDMVEELRKLKIPVRRE